jgi:hypothetical protein
MRMDSSSSRAQMAVLQRLTAAVVGMPLTSPHAAWCRSGQIQQAGPMLHRQVWVLLLLLLLLLLQRLQTR